jgi:hypothetical protein
MSPTTSRDPPLEDDEKSPPVDELEENPASENAEPGQLRVRAS